MTTNEVNGTSFKSTGPQQIMRSIRARNNGQLPGINATCQLILTMLQNVIPHQRKKYDPTRQRTSQRLFHFCLA